MGMPGGAVTTAALQGGGKKTHLEKILLKKVIFPLWGNDQLKSETFQPWPSYRTRQSAAC